MLDEASKGGDIGPLQIKGVVKDLEAEIERVLKIEGTCYTCGEPQPLLCRSCEEWEAKKERDHRDEVTVAFAATNGTL